jgi:hypothetical protein
LLKDKTAQVIPNALLAYHVSILQQTTAQESAGNRLLQMKHVLKTGTVLILLDAA